MPLLPPPGFASPFCFCFFLLPLLLSSDLLPAPVSLLLPPAFFVPPTIASSHCFSLLPLLRSPGLLPAPAFASCSCFCFFLLLLLLLYLLLLPAFSSFPRLITPSFASFLICCFLLLLLIPPVLAYFSRLAILILSLCFFLLLFPFTSCTSFFSRCCSSVYASYVVRQNGCGTE